MLKLKKNQRKTTQRDIKHNNNKNSTQTLIWLAQKIIQHEYERNKKHLILVNHKQIILYMYICVYKS